MGGCNHKPEISQLSFLIQFLKVLGGKGRDGLQGWVWVVGGLLAFFFVLFLCQFKLHFIMLSAMFRPLSKDCLPKIKRQFYYSTEELQKGI